MDFPSNPYMRFSTLKFNPGRKVVFFSEWEGRIAHEYGLMDPATGLGDIAEIISGSKLLPYYMKEFPAKRRQRSAAKPPPSGFPAIRQSYHRYLDHILSDHFKGAEIMGFRQRYLLFTPVPQSVQYVDATVYRAVEQWASSRNPVHSNLQCAPNHLARLLCLVGNGYPNLPDFMLEHYEKLGVNDDMAKRELSAAYRIGQEAGVKLHRHLELTLGGESPTTDLREEEDYVQVEEFKLFLESKKLNIFALEMTLGSFRNRICGSADMVIINDGHLENWDYKRTPSFNNEPWFQVVEGYDGIPTIECPMEQIDIQSSLFGYVIQQTTYRKLQQMNGFQVADTAKLVVFHPSLPTCRVVHLALNKRLHKDVMDRFQCDNAIQLVENIFAHREKDLIQRFGAQTECPLLK